MVPDSGHLNRDSWAARAISLENHLAIEYLYPFNLLAGSLLAREADNRLVRFEASGGGPDERESNKAV